MQHVLAHALGQAHLAPTLAETEVSSSRDEPLEAAGFSEMHADLLVENTEVASHRACALAARGRPHHTPDAILA
jgi:hypothetical protein